MTDTRSQIGSIYTCEVENCCLCLIVSCYYFSTNYLTWSESRDECRQKGGDLVQIDSREEQVKHTDKFWIGLTDSEKEGTWLWVDRSPLNKRLTFWSGKEPDNRAMYNPDGEDCVRMGKKAGAPDLKCWFDQSCKYTYRSICEKPAETGHFTLQISPIGD
uniref:C-type lectin domain-containing protein n=1 Tax=Dicentrarchus labrax TaxID=13489 RepID=A0A8C4GI66_DICLA